ncbi:hypothetical protein MHYP_G00219230 [Metynnis hypsauchen]
MFGSRISHDGAPCFMQTPGPDDSSESQREGGFQTLNTAEGYGVQVLHRKGGRSCHLHLAPYYWTDLRLLQKEVTAGKICEAADLCSYECECRAESAFLTVKRVESLESQRSTKYLHLLPPDTSYMFFNTGNNRDLPG